MTMTVPGRQMTDFDQAISVDDLRIERPQGPSTDTIVTSVSMTVGTGETIAIVGESGSGKSMTARAMVGLLPRGLEATGTITYQGRNLLGLSEREWRQIRGREVGLILQDPFTSLNPVMRCGRILEESLLGDERRSRRERRTEVVRRLAEVGITDQTVVDRYPFQLSGGMRQRVAIAAALARDPDVLIADEPSTALDATTQREILALLKRIQASRSMSLVLITHDLRLAFSLCDRVYVMYAGTLVEHGPADQIANEPLHPYTRGLLRSEPPADRRVGELPAIPGSVPAPDDVAGRCPFAPRCEWSSDGCYEGSPQLVLVEPARHSACVRLASIRTSMTEETPADEELHERSPSSRSDAPLIKVHDVSKAFDNPGSTVRALDGVSLQVGRGESVGIVGESGSGKTTLARMLVGLERPTSGGIGIDGINATDWGALSAGDRAHLRGTVQMVFQDPYSSLNPMRSIGSTLREAVRVHAPDAGDADATVGTLLQSVGLPPDSAHRRPIALSGGERQRVVIARALAANPDILVCDEAVSALDSSVQAQVLNLLARLRTDRGIGYLFITHDLAIARQVTDYLYVMYRGRVVEHGPTDDLLDHPGHAYTAELLAASRGSEM